MHRMSHVGSHLDIVRSSTVAACAALAFLRDGRWPIHTHVTPRTDFVVSTAIADRARACICAERADGEDHCDESGDAHGEVGIADGMDGLIMWICVGQSRGSCFPWRVLWKAACI
jgi:hypothetical protein